MTKWGTKRLSDISCSPDTGDAVGWNTLTWGHPGRALWGPCGDFQGRGVYKRQEEGMWCPLKRRSEAGIGQGTTSSWSPSFQNVLVHHGVPVLLRMGLGEGIGISDLLVHSFLLSYWPWWSPMWTLNANVTIWECLLWNCEKFQAFKTGLNKAWGKLQYMSPEGQKPQRRLGNEAGQSTLSVSEQTRSPESVAEAETLWVVERPGLAAKATLVLECRCPCPSGCPPRSSGLPFSTESACFWCSMWSLPCTV